MSNNIVMGFFVLCVDPHWLIDHESTLEANQGTDGERCFADFFNPYFGCGIVCFDEHDGDAIQWIGGMVQPVMAGSDIIYKKGCTAMVPVLRV